MDMLTLCIPMVTLALASQLALGSAGRLQRKLAPARVGWRWEAQVGCGAQAWLLRLALWCAPCLCSAWSCLWLMTK
jgi:hypothetical protein